MRYITQLTEKEKWQLKEGFRNGSTHRFRIRCQSILLSAEGYRINQLATMFSVDRDTVSRWLGQWEKEGLKGLRDQPRSGRPAKRLFPRIGLPNPSILREVCHRLTQSPDHCFGQIRHRE
ncbi:MAG: helix-turn-helix domain-containing protein [Cyclobacteriaceae bacterium]